MSFEGSGGLFWGSFWGIFACLCSCAAPVLPGAYQQSHSQGYGYMHQTSLSSMRSMQHSPNLVSINLKCFFFPALPILSPEEKSKWNTVALNSVHFQVKDKWQRGSLYPFKENEKFMEVNHWERKARCGNM